ncbi:CD63 antigen [Chanos chanos]|uniref:Tetraspanin n=1 Tax=Chanos chanos TaxID=29144 RepID=A0A6J2UXD2_CHACN|nr:CD63 antigen [Chanos chanos]
MAVEGGMKCVKFLLFFFNFIFWLCGLALIILGVLVQVALHNTLVIKGPSSSTAPLVLIIVGVVIFFIAFFGCCGAWKESRCMVTMFAILLSLIIIIEIGTAIAGYIFRGKLNDVVENSFKDMINQYNNASSDYKKTVDDMQQQLRCCGVHNSSDWLNFKPDKKSVPDSCCKNVTAKCGDGAIEDSNKIYLVGCQSVVEKLLRDNILWVAVGALVIALFQILGLVFSCLLIRAIRSGYEVM